MLLLLLSIMALFAGPALLAVVGKQHTVVVAIDAFVVVAIGGLVIFHIFPESLSDAGWPAAVAIVTGLLAPLWLHGFVGPCQGRNTQSLVSLAIAAVALHAFLDGVALVDRSAAGHALALAVVLHRVLEGLGVWWIVRPYHGPRGTAWLLGVIAASTVLGFFGAQKGASLGLDVVVNILQAFVAGSLLHVLLRHAPEAASLTKKPLQWSSCVGGSLALLLLTALGWADATRPGVTAATGPWFTFCSLADLSAAPMIVALLSVALSHAFLSGLRLPLLTCHGGQVAPAFRGASVGLISAVCSCGVLPLYRHLRRQQAAPAAALAFLVAAPGFGAAALFMSLACFGPLLTALWGCAVFLCAFGTGVALGHAFPESKGREHQTQPIFGAWRFPQSLAILPQRLLDGLQFALGEVLDAWAPWLLFGLGLAALLNEVIPAGWIRGLQELGLEIPILSLIATPLYVSGTAAALIGVVLLAKGASVGALLAFLVSSGAVCLSTASFLSQTQNRRAGPTMIALIWGVAVMAGYGANGLSIPTVMQPLRPPAGWHLGCAWGCACLAAAAYLRQGVRPFLGQVAIPNTVANHSHHHNHGSHAP